MALRSVLPIENAASWGAQHACPHQYRRPTSRLVDVHLLIVAAGKIWRFTARVSRRDTASRTRALRRRRGTQRANHPPRVVECGLYPGAQVAKRFRASLSFCIINSRTRRSVHSSQFLFYRRVERRAVWCHRRVNTR